MDDMRLELTSPDGIRGVVLISEETGRTELVEGEGTDLVEECKFATDSVRGWIEVWIPPYDVISKFCEERGIAVAVPGGLPDRVPLPKGVIA